MLKRLVNSINVRLIGAYLLMAILALGTGAFGYIQIDRINGILVQGTTRAEARYLGTKIRISVLQISNLVDSYVGADSAAARARLATQLANEQTVLEEFLAQLGEQLTDVEEQAMWPTIASLVQTYLSQAQAVIDTGGAQIAMDDLGDTRVQLLEALTAFEGQETSLVYASQLVAREVVRNSLTIALGLTVAAFVGVFVVAWLIPRSITRPIGNLVEVARRITAGDLEQSIEVRGETEVSLLARAFSEMTVQLRELIGSLEQRVAERTQDLTRRTVQLEATARVARDASAIRDVKSLLDRTVRLITERFGFYHAGVFTIDTAGEYAILRAANSEGGQRMLARSHMLRVGQVGIVGTVAGTGRPRIALDVGADTVFFDNPDLPDTRSEMALPLKIRERVIGVLDAQSTEAAAFTDEDIEVLQVLADQIALAIENARLLAESQQAVDELSALYGKQTRRAWEHRLQGRPLVYTYNRLGVEPVEPAQVEGTRQEVALEPTIVSEDGIQKLIAPIVVRGQVLGTVVLRREVDQDPWGQDELAVIEEALTQIAPALENARLLGETQSLATREQAVNIIATEARSSVNLDTILQNTVRELGKTLGVSRTFIQFGQFGIDRETDADADA